MYQIISEDIVRFSGDAIINSLGKGVERIVDMPGTVFRSILEVTGNAIAKEVFEKGKDLPFGAGFITDSYGLPCKKIVHVVTPYRWDDDEECRQLRMAYDFALKLAYDSGIRSLCVPMIGASRANGYSPNESFKAARMAAFEFCETHKDFNAFLDVFGAPKQERALVSKPTINSCAGRRRRNYDSDGIFFESNMEEDYGEFGVPRRPHRYEMAMPELPEIGKKIPVREINMDYLGVRVGDSLGRLLDLFLAARDGLDPDDVKALVEPWKEISSCLIGVIVDETEMDSEDIPDRYKYRWHKHADTKNGKKKTPGLKQGQEDPNGLWNKPNKLDILITACALEMDAKQCNFLMKFCGYYLSKFDEFDLAVKKCYKCLASSMREAAPFSVYSTFEEIAGYNPLTGGKKS